ncbi:unnamed protein product [Clonostachys rosea]|uniref:Xaa-Pro dipeptidyl-peptidase-like domain-containing protein n=1 Tax=Bionectria ochroleuca TaxID=29856 RepID=A0ABY6V0X8_BIOOC|nr:unnamed protein product [Clonostachys rosea]
MANFHIDLSLRLRLSTYYSAKEADDTVSASLITINKLGASRAGGTNMSDPGEAWYTWTGIELIFAADWRGNSTDGHMDPHAYVQIWGALVATPHRSRLNASRHPRGQSLRPWVFHFLVAVSFLHT